MGRPRPVAAFRGRRKYIHEPPPFYRTPMKGDNPRTRCPMTKRQQFSVEFKQEAVRLVKESGRTLTSIAKELGVDRKQLYKWIKALDTAPDPARAFPGAGAKPLEERSEIERLNLKSIAKRYGIDLQALCLDGDVVSHEFGHHVEQITGAMDAADRGGSVSRACSSIRSWAAGAARSRPSRSNSSTSLARARKCADSSAAISGCFSPADSPTRRAP